MPKFYFAGLTATVTRNGVKTLYAAIPALNTVYFGGTNIKSGSYKVRGYLKVASIIA